MKLLSLVLCIATLAGCSSAPTRPASVARGDLAATQAYVTRLVQHDMAQDKVTGLSLALVDDQRIVWAQGFGFADVEQGMPASADTIYRVGSISKLFTATAAMQLAERGLLDIDKPVKIKSPETITPRQLMTHHSGLPRDRLKGFQTPQPQPFASLLDDLTGEPLAYPPGQVFSYSNVGISLLGTVLQTLSGTAFAQHMQQSVLTPLGMAHSAFETGVSNSPLMAKGYRGREAVPETPLRDVPAGGLNASVNDLSRFMAMVFADGRSGTQQVLKPETVAEMLRPQNSAVPLDFNFQTGLGWMLSTLGSSTLENAGPVAHHAGAIGMFRSQMYLLPKHKLGIVVLANSATATRVVDHIATETLALALEAKTGITQPAHVKPAWADAPLPAAMQSAHVGHYTTFVGPVHIRADGGDLRVNAVGHDFKLRPRSDGLLGLDYALLGLVSLDLGTLSEIGFSRRTVAGRDLLVARVGTQDMLVGQRMEPPASLGAWQQRLGDYDISNLGDDPKVAQRIRLIEEQGFLVLEITQVDEPDQAVRAVLKPLSDTQALLLGPLADSGETVRSVTVDGVEQLAYSGYLARKRAQH
ncbi:D-aminopeptidase [Rhodoferax lithotrophicus]|uniref:D-aminopeptidase n=1 Tax=Rhodoferax lithotrophicus TaxID=2798804 RepID=A0ABM7MJY7_9BURK|nr:serine hydrolase domain-containing protein [Rhodoferax sp. MIZ03]BCO26516.1 D-aminopeptidase [Rhodoferax sp. MIZ03]